MKKSTDKKLAKEQKIAIAAVFFLLILGFIAFFVFGFNRYVDKDETKEVEKKTEPCGTISAENNLLEGKSPFTPNLKAKILGSYDSSKPVCEWSMDGAPLFKSYVVNGYCMFINRSLASHGEHEISYKVAGLAGCPKKIKINVLK